MAADIALWFSQISTLISRRLNHLQPADYAVGLVICMAAGWFFLRGQD